MKSKRAPPGKPKQESPGVSGEIEIGGAPNLSSVNG